MLNKLKERRVLCAAALLTMFIVQMVMHLNVDNLLLDDWAFKAVLIRGESIPSFLHTRWNTWSSRLIIEAVLVVITHSIWTFRILDSLMMVLMAWCLCRLAACEERPHMLALAGCMVTAIPFAILRSTGWMATGLNYYWPLACTACALVPLADTLWQRKTERRWQIAAVLCAFFGANQEQTSAVIVGGCLVFGTALLIRDKKIRPVIAIVFAIGAVQLVLHLIAPGNAVRADCSTAAVNLRDYDQYSLVDKLSIGLTSTPGILVYRYCYVLLATGMVIAGTIIARRRGMAASFPMLFVFVFQGIAKFLPRIEAENVLFMPVRQYRAFDLQLGPEHIGEPSQMIMMFISIMLLGLMALTLYLSIGHRSLSAAAVMVFAIGFAARMALSFSPTVVESGERTMLPLYGAMILCALLCVKDCRKEGAKRWPLDAAGMTVLYITVQNVIRSFALAA